MTAKYIASSLLIITSLSFSAIATSASAAPAKVLQNICDDVEQNDHSAVRKKLKIMRKMYDMRLTEYYDSISCSGNSLLRVAIKNSALDAGKLLARKIRKNALQSPEQDGNTLVGWASANGYDSNPVTQEVLKRLN